MRGKQRQVDQHALQDVINQLGRGDIGIGDLAEVGPFLLCTLNKGGQHMSASLPLLALSDKIHLKLRVLRVLVAFNRMARTRGSKDDGYTLSEGAAGVVAASFGLLIRK